MEDWCELRLCDVVFCASAMHENWRQKSYIQENYKKKQFLLKVTLAASGASRQFPV